MLVGMFMVQPGTGQCLLVRSWFNQGQVSACWYVVDSTRDRSVSVEM